MLELTDHPNPGLLQRAVRWLLPRAARFDRYDEASRRTLSFAREAVSELGGNRLEPEHLLLGLLKEQPQVVRQFLNPSIPIERLSSQVRKSVADADRVPESVEVPFSKAATRVLRKSMDEAGGTRARIVRPEHLLLGLLAEGASVSGILTAHGVAALEVRKHLGTMDE